MKTLRLVRDRVALTLPGKSQAQHSPRTQSPGSGGARSIRVSIARPFRGQACRFMIAPFASLLNLRGMSYGILGAHAPERLSVMPP